MKITYKTPPVTTGLVVSPKVPLPTMASYCGYCSAIGVSARNRLTGPAWRRLMGMTVPFTEAFGLTPDCPTPRESSLPPCPRADPRLRAGETSDAL